MPQVISTNIASLNAQRQLNRSQSSMQTSMERLSSGMRINSAKDDAAGLAISDRMTAQIKGLNQAVRNANDGISVAQTAEGSLGQITDALQRMRELSVQSANDTNSAGDRASLQKEVAQLQQDITRIAAQTQFNGKNLLDGSFTSQKFQIGAYADQTISFSIGNAKATNIGANNVDGNGTLNNALAGVANKAAITHPVVATEDLTVTGSLGTSSIAVNLGDSARTVATAVNAATSSTGVDATAITKASLQNLGSAGTVSFNLYGSNTGSPVAISANVSSTSDLTSLADAINASASSTGITAELSSNRSAITFNQADGYDVVIEDFNNSGATKTVDLQGLDQNGATKGAAQTLTGGAATDTSMVGGTVSFNSSNSFTVTSGAAGGLFSGTTANSSSLSAVGGINVGSQSGANSAIKSIDGALAFVDGLRADLGAIQNRFSSAISNLQTTAENVTSARSGIQDADFAAETAALSRSQILQQAGTAMLAQANASAQNVLSLLRG
jgi:flagellin